MVIMPPDRAAITRQNPQALGTPMAEVRMTQTALCLNDLHVGMTWGKPSRHGALGGAEANDERRYVP